MIIKLTAYDSSQKKSISIDYEWAGGCYIIDLKENNLRALPHVGGSSIAVTETREEILAEIERKRNGTS